MLRVGKMEWNEINFMEDSKLIIDENVTERVKYLKTNHFYKYLNEH